jgi:hypothetical protein
MYLQTWQKKALISERFTLVDNPQEYYTIMACGIDGMV